MDPKNNQQTSFSELPVQHLTGQKFNGNDPLDFTKKPHHKAKLMVIVLIILILVVAAVLYAAISQTYSEPEPIVTIPMDSAASHNTNTTIDSSYATTTPAIAPITGKSDDIQSLQNDLNDATNGVDSQSI
ncbi:MAG: hypothetical protein NTU85_00015 [Candidatus Kaiserbacteria bacterium]|nr:hypothetical protein [Candidatus Kaiserbacteria bacterium]